MLFPSVRPGSTVKAPSSAAILLSYSTKSFNCAVRFTLTIQSVQSGTPKRSLRAVATKRTGGCLRCLVGGTGTIRSIEGRGDNAQKLSIASTRREPPKDRPSISTDREARQPRNTLCRTASARNCRSRSEYYSAYGGREHSRRPTARLAASD